MVQKVKGKKYATQLWTKQKSEDTYYKHKICFHIYKSAHVSCTYIIEDKEFKIFMRYVNQNSIELIHSYKSNNIASKDIKKKITKPSWEIGNWELLSSYCFVLFCCHREK